MTYAAPVIISSVTSAQLPGMGGWIEYPAGGYALTKISDQASRCQIELTIPYVCWVYIVQFLIIFNSYDALKASDSGIPNAPLRILYFDIESMTREDPKKPGKFISESLHDPVIQISNIVSHPGKCTFSLDLLRLIIGLQRNQRFILARDFYCWVVRSYRRGLCSIVRLGEGDVSCLAAIHPRCRSRRHDRLEYLKFRPGVSHYSESSTAF